MVALLVTKSPQIRELETFFYYYYLFDLNKELEKK